MNQMDTGRMHVAPAGTAVPESNALAQVPHSPAAQMTLWLHAAAAHVIAWAGRCADPDLLARTPVLERYRETLDAVLPGAGPARWRAAVLRWEDGASDLPFLRAAQAFGLSPVHRIAIAVILLAEEDSRFGRFFASLQGTQESQPNAETLMHILAHKAPEIGSALDLVAPLMRAGLVLERRWDGLRAARPLAVPGAVWDLMRGALRPDLPPGVRILKARDAQRLDDLIATDALRGQCRRAAGLLIDGTIHQLCLRCAPGTDTERIAGAIARAAGQNMLTISPAETANLPQSLIGALAATSGSWPLYHLDPGPGETVKAPDPGAWQGPVLLALGQHGGIDFRTPAGESDLRQSTIEIPFPERALRMQHWKTALGDMPPDVLEQICDRFHVSDGHLKRVAGLAHSIAALEGRKSVRPEDVRHASRELGRQQLERLAEPLDPVGDWDALALPDITRNLLEALEARCRHREQLPAHLGQTRTGSTGRGVRALFTGPSGTGKTLAARVLANELGMDLYRVDLSAVVDKYVGETEKNLHQLLIRAEALDVILLLDEGEALMARRTDVRSANDRFANLETNFLLQRLESHEGIVIVTTNLPDGIDPAFQRRMDVAVAFNRPDMAERLAIWRSHLPADHTLTLRELDALASTDITGGQIRNAVRHGLSRALSDRSGLGASQLREGISRELQKAGAIPPAEPKTGPGGATRLSRLASALSDHRNAGTR